MSVSYTQDDLISGKVFNEIAKIENETKREIVLAEKAKEAKQYGITVARFKELYKNQTSKAAQTDQGNTLRFSNVPSEIGGKRIECGNYICTDRGVELNGRTVCLPPILPVCILQNVEDHTESVRIAYKERGKGQEWKTLVRDMSVISSPDIGKLASFGVNVTSETARPLGTYLSTIVHLNREVIPTAKSVSRLGWISETEFSPFCGVEFDGDESFSTAFEAMSPKGSELAWFDAVKPLRAKSKPIRIALAASFASVLLEKVGALGFLVHIWGQTGYGKSVCGMVAASVWGSPEIGRGYVQTFDGTKSGKALFASYLHNVPLILDELQIAAASGEVEFDKMIFELCEGAERQRATASVSYRQGGKWKLCVLSTGEQPIVSGKFGGAAARVVEVELSKAICDNLPEIAEIVKENYGHAGKRFVQEWSSDAGAEDRDSFRSNFKDMRKRLEDRGIDPKRSASLALLYAADALASERIFGVDDGSLTEGDLIELARVQTETDVNKAAAAYRLDKIEQNPLRFWNGCGEPQTTLPIWGEIDADKVRFFRAALDEIVRDGGYSTPAAFVKWMGKHDVLSKQGEDNRHTVKRHGDRFVEIDRAKLLELLKQTPSED